MNLQQLRDYIRVQLDMDEEELPNTLLDSYLNEGFLRTISLETRWPFYETRWDVTAVDGRLTAPTNCDLPGITGLTDLTTGAALVQIGNEYAELSFPGAIRSAHNPAYYTIYGNEITVWPLAAFDSLRNYRLRGQRLPTDWVTQGAGAEPDCDYRLHQLLAHYAIALCYAQQEDEVLEDVYMKRWQASWAAAHNAICRPRHQRPLVFNVGLPVTPNTSSVVWASPPVHP